MASKPSDLARVPLNVKTPLQLLVKNAGGTFSAPTPITPSKTTAAAPATAGTAHKPFLLSPAYQRTYLRYEFHKICDNPVPRIYVLPGETLTCWYGVIFVDKGPWAGGAFHFRLTIPPTYPSDAPLLSFDNLYHPRMKSRPTRVDDLFGKFRPWDYRKHSIRQVLEFMPVLFLERTFDTYASKLDAQTCKEVRAKIEKSARESIRLLPQVCGGYSSIKFSAPHPNHLLVESAWRKIPRDKDINGNQLLSLIRRAFITSDFLTDEDSRRTFVPRNQSTSISSTSSPLLDDATSSPAQRGRSVVKP